MSTTTTVTHPDGTTVTCTTTAASAPASLVLKYWNGRGLMEVARQLLAIAGKFPGTDYEDVRVGEGATPMDEVKDTLDANLGRMPVCEADGVSIGQGPAIHLYIAMTHGLAGANALETAQIISIKEALSELNSAFRALIPYGSTPTEDNLAKFFEDETANDYSGMAVGANRSSRMLKWYMGRLEGIVGAGGTAVGSSISLADVLIYNAFAECLTEAEAPDKEAWQRAPYNDAKRMEAALAAHPKLKAICDTVAAHEGIKKWLGMRGVQGF